MTPTSEWKKLKGIISGPNALENLKSVDQTSLQNFRNNHGKNLIHVAAKRSSLEVTEYLIKSGCNYDLKDEKHGLTPLTFALLRNDDEGKKIAKLLLFLGVDMSWTDIRIGKQSDVLFRNNQDIANKLCSALKSYEGSFQAAADHLLSKGWTFENIAYLQHDNITKCALKNDHVLNENYLKLVNAITNQDLKTIHQLFDLVSHSKRITSWLLEHAIKSRGSKSVYIIKLLLDKGAPINGFVEDHGTLLEKALFTLNSSNILILLDHGAKIKNFKFFEAFNYVFLLGSMSSGTVDHTYDSGEQESFKNCLRVLVEHQGIKNSYELIKRFSKTFQDSRCLKIEYLTVLHHLAGKNFLISSDDDDDEDEDIEDYEYYKECTEELEKMKNIQSEDGICLISLLPLSIDEVIPFTKDYSLMSKIKAESFVGIFPHFGKTLQFKVNMAIKKKFMMDRSVDVLSKCLPNLGSCIPALERIVHYLKDPYALSLYWYDFFPQL